jgi:hypothetical protein
MSIENVPAMLVNKETLTPVVRRILDDDTAQLGDWQLQHLQGGVGGGLGTTSVHRLDGQAKSTTGSVTWSVILKILNRHGDDNPAGSHYWRREADAYQSGVLDELPGRLRAPRCYAVTEEPNRGICLLWLENVKEDTYRKWDLTRYAQAARILGTFNGAYLSGKQYPNYPWLSVDWVRSNIRDMSPVIEELRRSLDNPFLKLAMPGDAPQMLLRLWEHRERLLDTLDTLPQTLCHHDAFRRNLLADKDEMVAIDWAFMGKGAVGEELAALVWVSLFFMEIPHPEARKLDATAFAAYLEGLRCAGWRGNQRCARLGYTIAMAMRRLVTIRHDLPKMLNQSRHAELQRMTGRSIDDIMEHFAAIGLFVEHLTAEAYDLL